MNKLKALVASVALAAGLPAMAAYHSTPAPMVPCKQNQLLPRLDRNQSDFFAQCDWEKRIKLSGYVKTTFGMANDVWGRGNNDVFHQLTFNSKVPASANENVDSGNDLWLERAVLNVDSVINDWAEAHVSALYWNDLSIFNNADAMFYNRYHGRLQGNGNSLPIDEANVVLGNFAQNPIYFRVGRQYMDFGWYDKSNGIATLPQLFSQGLHDAVQVGFVDVSGFSGSLQVFRSVDRGSNENAALTGGQDRPQESVNNFVASADYSFDNGTMSLDVKVDYIRDMFGVDFLDGYNGNGVLGSFPAGFNAQGLVNANWIRPDNNTTGWALSAKAKYGDFDAMGQWVGANKDFDKNIWSSGGAVGANGNVAFQAIDVDGARPSAWMLEFGYSFPLLGRDSRLSLNYQKTQDAMLGSFNDNANQRSTNYYVPERRYVVGFEHNLMKNVDMSVSYYRDKDYATGHTASIGNTGVAGNFGAGFRNNSGTGNANSMFVANLTGRFN